MSKRPNRGVCWVMVLLLSSLCVSISHSQINVAGNQTAAALASKLAGQGVVILNPVLNCPSQANGFFNSNELQPGFDSGIVLTTGRAATSGTSYGVNGYSALLANNNNGTPGDAMLDALAGQPTLDACSLEFDMKPLGDTLSVDYVFSSEEYISAVCGPYNDAFAFFISGPGITGMDNMALVPGTDIPVTINSINNGVPGSTGAIANCTVMGPGSPFTSYYLDNSNGNWLTHKGLTTVLKAMHPVDKCSTYHFKIVIADAGNPYYDSGVFLKAGSLQTAQYHIQPNIDPAYDSTSAVCIKGCLPGSFTINRSIVRTSPQTIHFIAHGTAVSGYDYAALPDSVIIPANATSTTLTINGLVTPAIGQKTLQLIILSPTCDGSIVVADSAMMVIYDTLHVSVTPADTVLCSGASIHFRVSSEDLYTYHWTPSSGLSNSNIKEPVATPYINTIYTVTASLPGTACPSKSGTAFVDIKLSPLVYLVGDTNVCYHSSFTLSPDVQPFNANYSYSWIGPAGFTSSLSSPSLNTVGLQNSGVYTFTVTNDTNFCAVVSEINVLVNTPDSPAVVSPVIYCVNNKPESLTASGTDLHWYNVHAGTETDIAPIIPTTSMATYEYQVTQTINNCESPRSTVNVSVIQCCDGGIFIPTAFSPNNDGLNDYFEPRPDYGYFIKAVTIVNRWGEVMYSGTDGKWNGKCGLRDAEAGTYYYRMIFGCIEGGTTERKGDIILIR